MNLIKNKWFLIALVALTALWIGFKNRDSIKYLFGGYSKTPTGLRYKFLQGSENKKNLGGGLYMLINYMLIGPDNDTIINNFASDTLMEIPYPVEPKEEMLEALSMMNTGSTIEVLVLSDSLKKRVENNPNIHGFSKIMFIESGRNAKFIIKVKHVLNEEEYEAYKNKKLIARVEIEGAMIDKLVDKSPNKYLLDSFLHFRYFIFDINGKEKIKNSDEIEYNLEVYTLDGKLITNSAMEGKKYHAIIGKSTYDLPALDILPTYLAEGEYGQFVVTSALGFGAKGAQNVPSYSPLVIKIFDIKKLN